MKTSSKLLTFIGALTGAFVGTLLVPGIGTAVGVIVGIAVGWRFSKPRGEQAPSAPGPVL